MHKHYKKVWIRSKLTIKTPVKFKHIFNFEHISHLFLSIYLANIEQGYVLWVGPYVFMSLRVNLLTFFGDCKVRWKYTGPRSFHLCGGTGVKGAL